MISREEAIERLERMLDETQVVCNSYTATEPIRSALKKDEETYRMAIEALSTERPKGRWMRDRHHGAYCSNCKRYTKNIIPEKFCGHCGSDNN